MSDEQQTTKVTSVALTPELADAALRAANARGLSRSAWVRQLIESALYRATGTRSTP